MALSLLAFEPVSPQSQNPFFSKKIFAIKKNSCTFATAKCPSGGIGRRAGFRDQCSQGRAGSSPVSGTEKDGFRLFFVLRIRLRII